jgi:parallel beta-helix repeat protein
MRGMAILTMLSDTNRRRALLLACLPVAFAVTGTADDLCGATILDNLRLDQDLVCLGDGLIVGADRLTIDLNGHTISGVGVGVGIIVTGRTDVSITNGTIRDFAIGIRLNTATDVVIKHNAFTRNLEGIDLQSGSVGNTVKNNRFSDSATRAIMLRSNSRDNDIKDNDFTNNRIGILVFGGVDNTLKNNLVSGSTLAGVRLNVIATGNVLKDNRIVSNATGVDFIVTPTGSATGNELKGNTIATNDCGVKGLTAGNSFTGNMFDGNVADTCS